MKHLILFAVLPTMGAGVAVAVAASPVAAQSDRMAPPSPPNAGVNRQQQEHDLSLVLGLRDTQRVALDAFVEAERPPMPPRGPWGGHGESRQNGPDAAPPSFEQDLARGEAADAERARDSRARLTAGRTFYAQLDSRQRQVFDALLRLRRHPGGPRRPGREGPDEPGREGGPPPMPTDEMPAQ